jgi:hypothetical protein
LRGKACAPCAYVFRIFLAVAKGHVKAHGREAEMARLAPVGIVTSLAVWAVAGCARHTCVRDNFPQPTEAISSEALTVVSERPSLQPDDDALKSYKLEERDSLESTSASGYRVLDAERVQRWAAASAPVANAIRSERRPARAEHVPMGCAETVKSQMLVFRDIDERNRVAARALESFYLLAEVEANRDLLRGSLGEIDRTIAYFDRLKGEGIQIPLDEEPAAAEIQRLDLLGRRAQLSLTREKLSGLLRQSVGLDVDDTVPIWPAADLKVTIEPIDVEEAVSVGLALRADIGLLRSLSRSLDVETLAIVREALSEVNSVLGTSFSLAGKSRPLRRRLQEQAEVQTRRRQLKQLLAHQERVAAGAIRQAVRVVEIALDQIALAQAKLDNKESRVRSLKLRRASPGGPTAFDVSAAKLEVIQAKSDLLHQVIAWRIAQVRLKEAQGLLAYECGYRLPGSRYHGERLSAPRPPAG